MDCPKHPIRKRPKACQICAANLGTTVAEAVNAGREDGGLRPVFWPEDKPAPVVVQRVSEDGLTWLDRDGNPPKLDAKGRLTEPFVFIPNAAHNCYERWGAGLTLPMTPVALRAFYAEEEARRARIHKRKDAA